MDLQELMEWRRPVEQELARYFRGAAQHARRQHPDLVPFVEAAEEFTLRGGKRFRACLVFAGHYLAAGRNARVALPAAAAMEAFQSWMLIHDDIMDHGETRRGGPTLHVAMARRHSAQHLSGSDADFGEAIAITVGDLLEPATVRLLLACKVPDGRSRALLSEYYAMTEATAYGQLLDILNGVRPVPKVRERDVLTVHRLKSAVYTVSSPLRLGGTIAGASDGLLRSLSAIGDDLGVAFQLRDDILGARQVPGSDVGKSTNDLYEGKRTLLVVRAWQRTGRDGREALSKVLGNPLATPEEFDRAITILEETGAFDYSEKRIAELVASAEARIRRSSLDAARKSLLLEIGQLLTQRSS